MNARGLRAPADSLEIDASRIHTLPRAGTCVGPAHATSLFNRYMKAQLRLVGGRRKLGRNGLSSDRPRGCLALPNLRDLRDLRAASSGRRGPTSNIPAKYSCLARGIPNFANTQAVKSLYRRLSTDMLAAAVGSASWRPHTLDAPLPPLPIRILEETDRWCIVAKPAGMMVHKNGFTKKGDAVLMQTVRDQLGRYVHPVHRLDGGTSGCVVFGYDSATTALLQAAMQAPTARKTYLAHARGDATWVRDDHVVDRAIKDDNGVRKEAHTTFSCIAGVGDCPERSSLLRCVPTTGRWHQIRKASRPPLRDAMRARSSPTYCCLAFASVRVRVCVCACVCACVAASQRSIASHHWRRQARRLAPQPLVASGVWLPPPGSPLPRDVSAACRRGGHRRALPGGAAPHLRVARDAVVAEGLRRDADAR